ncbi:MAG: sigma-54 dependent transcriptional regulator [Planctomycetota bacterium]|nr:sigma-54 dependent transcriptional regulator [Planctomycetota bacterium]MEC9049064.1 sigma-54 dependent transcriptional regulator [Planctomycetota bacterium]
MTEAATVLIVDDHRAVREELAFALNFDGWTTVEAEDGPSGLARALEPDVDLVLLDVKLPDLDGLEVLQQLKAARPELPVVMISGHGDLETAVLAVRRGAYDFLQKPFESDRVLLSIQNALRTSRLQSENEALREAIQSEQQMLGSSAAIEGVRAAIQKAAPTDVAVLITGENGTGKELVARQLHLQSKRSAAAFLAVNCAAIPADLAESELFGHEKGAFTGAERARAGAFELADGGTLFLDEVGDMPLPMQAKLLRALQEGSFQRLGSQAATEVDVRVLAATNQDLEQMVAEKTFREDLYYRLHVIRVHLPPLRERPEDVAMLADHFLKAATQRNGLGRRCLHQLAYDWLRRQPWPGNVRQLKNVLEGAAVLADAAELQVADLEGTATPGAAARSEEGNPDWFAFERLEDFRAATEKEFLRRKLLEFSGNIKRTAENIQLQRSNLYKKLDRYGLK